MYCVTTSTDILDERSLGMKVWRKKQGTRFRIQWAR